MEYSEQEIKWAMDTLQFIADLTADCKGGIGKKVNFQATSTLTHITIAKLARRAGEVRNN